MHEPSAAPAPLPSPRDRVLDGATELFARHGYQAIGLRDLAGHVGIKPGSLYHHIDSKQALLFELIEATLSDLLFGTRLQLKRAADARDALQVFIKAFLAFRRTTPERIAVLVREQINLDTAQQHEIDDLKREYVAVLSGIIAQLLRHKAEPTAAMRMAADAVLTLLFGQEQWAQGVANEQQQAELLGHVAYSIIVSVAG